MSTKPLQYFEIPPNSRASKCKGCQATVYFVPNQHGRMVPVDPDADSSTYPPAPQKGQEGRGLNHFQNCPHASAFSGKKKPDRKATT
jgi:hypothetical protein